jgi:hypothetical protein
VLVFPGWFANVVMCSRVHTRRAHAGAARPDPGTFRLDWLRLLAYDACLRLMFLICRRLQAANYMDIKSLLHGGCRNALASCRKRASSPRIAATDQRGEREVAHRAR